MARANSKAEDVIAEVKKDIQIQKKVNRSKKIKCKVYPADTTNYDEVFARAGMTKVPFDVPVILTEHQIRLIKGQKEPYSRKRTVDVKQIMREQKVSQEIANRIAQATEVNDMDREIKWRNKYIVEYL